MTFKIVLKRLCFLVLLLLSVNTWAQSPANSVFSPSSEVVGQSVTHAATHFANPSDFTAGGLPYRLVSNMGISLDTPKIKGNKLVGSGAEGNARQGFSVSLSGDGKTAIVGGAGDNNEMGAVWIYQNVKGVWSQDGGKLIGSGAVGNAYQGSSVAFSADGKTVIVGGFGDDGAKGAAWIYRNINGVWRQEGSKLVGLDAVNDSWQGSSVSLSADGNTAIVGGLKDYGDKGATWIFRYSKGVWHQDGNKLVGLDAVGDALQGSSVSLSADGNTAIVGGVGDDGLKGAVWIYRYVNGVWVQDGNKLVGSGAVGDAVQGSSVSLSADGKTAIVGGYGDDGFKGAVWIYRNKNGVWRQQGKKLVGSGAVGAAQQGYSLSLSADGKTAVFGGSYDDDGKGAVWIFRYVNGVWRQEGNKLVGSGDVGSAFQGRSVFISENARTLIVGGPQDDEKKGAVWIYKNVNGSWVQY
jgi:hypothetical protein